MLQTRLPVKQMSSATGGDWETRAHDEDISISIIK